MAEPGVTDDDAEPNLVLSPNGFTVTASALSNPPPNPINDPITTQTAGTSFPLHLTAYGVTPTDPVCGVIEAYRGAKTLKFWSTYSDPSSGTVAATIDGTTIATSSGSAANQAVAFTAGQALVTAKYKDVGEIQISMMDDSPVEPAAGITGVTNLFVSMPADFVVTTVGGRLHEPQPPGRQSPQGRSSSRPARPST